MRDIHPLDYGIFTYIRYTPAMPKEIRLSSLNILNLKQSNGERFHGDISKEVE